MTIEKYIESVNSRYLRGNSTEHTFRGDLQQLIETLVPTIQATNEPKRQKCGAPDYIITKKDIPIGFIEAKDIGDTDLEGLKKTGNKEQFDRYKISLDNIIFTNYLDFYFYNNNILISKISIGEITNKGIVPLSNNFNGFENLLIDFCTYTGQTIKSSKKLAEMMANKARLLSDVIEKSLTSDENTFEDSTLKDQMNAFKEILIHDITPKGFADVYAQTIAYGMFAARLHDPTLPTFSRQEASELIPRSNPFLRQLFGYIAGPEIDDRIKWIVDSLVDVFLHCNVEEILKNYGKTTKMEEPIIHFYETFLSEYDPKLRKARGVWYTPQPVVDFIVRAVDDILKTEFDLPNGLADNTKTKVKIEQQGKKVEQEVHKVQILDPATGTGTFLAEVVKHIYKKFEGQQGIWSNYVANHLLPRLNGFELLMASYAMAHLKLDLLLTETGYKPTSNQRFKIFLTNSLEEYNKDTGTLFANWLSIEANEANKIKRDTPVMCVLGNPPYAVSSNNKNNWIENLIYDYKKDLNEKSYNSLSDDYVKFIRYGQHFIDKNGSGILAFITNNSFLDGIVFRQMRKHLLKSFDKIYVLDLHGNSKKKEINIDGSLDQNVFDIMQGVSINIFIKTNRNSSNKLAEIYNFDLFGNREYKYDYLRSNNIKSVNWQKLLTTEPNYYFVNKDFKEKENYEKGFKIDELFNVYGPGVESGYDKLFVNNNKNELTKTFKDISYKNKEVFDLLKIENKSSFKLKDRLIEDDFQFIEKNIVPYQYKAFDFKYIAYLKNSLRRADYNVFKNHGPDNLYLILMRSTVDTLGFESVFVSKTIIDKNFYGFQSYAFPIYIISENNAQNKINQFAPITDNFNKDIINNISEKIKLNFTISKINNNNTFATIDVLDYIYGVLFSPIYREKYKEFLKIDFPRLPYPKDTQTFWELVKLGGEIRALHLLESSNVEKYITQYPIDGQNNVEKVKYFEGKVYINESQYFDNVPQIAWEFYIGGYQPAQKWLKDRKDQKLEFDDILHYQKIIVALSETNRLMKEIEKIEIE